MDEWGAEGKRSENRKVTTGKKIIIELIQQDASISTISDSSRIFCLLKIVLKYLTDGSGKNERGKKRRRNGMR